MSLFITFEGGEGSGKSLQSKKLFRKFEKMAIPTILIQEPGGTPLGRKIRNLLKHSSGISISPVAELLLFNASRCQLVQDVIQPALNENKIVICDRFSDSTLAYQSYGRGIDFAEVSAINKLAESGLKPDLTFLFDVPPEIGLARKNAEANDRFEKEKLSFHQKVRKGFLELATSDQRRWTIIDATLPPEKISLMVWQKVLSFID
jgi:dTMP kinase